MRPKAARDALLAIHGGLSLGLCAVIGHLSPMALYRLVCAFGQQSLVTVLMWCELPLPTYFLADGKHSHCLRDRVYLPTIVSGRVIWHLGYTEAASAAAFTRSYQEFQRAASEREPSYRVRGILTDGFDSTISSMRALFPGSRLGNCLRHAITKLPGKLTAIASPVRRAFRSQFHTLLYRARQRKDLRVFALGRRLRRFADHVAHSAGTANGARVRRWVQEKKAGRYAVLEDPQMRVTSTLLDQAHNAIGGRRMGSHRGLVPQSADPHLCANADIFPPTLLEEISESAWDDVFATNLKGMLFSIKAALPHLKQSTAGRTVLTSSITGPLTGYPGWSH